MKENESIKPNIVNSHFQALKWRGGGGAYIQRGALRNSVNKSIFSLLLLNFHFVYKCGS